MIIPQARREPKKVNWEIETYLLDKLEEYAESVHSQANYIATEIIRDYLEHANGKKARSKK